jgi:hypothetical protein
MAVGHLSRPHHHTTCPMLRLSPHRLAGDWALFIAFGTFFAAIVSHG